MKFLELQQNQHTTLFKDNNLQYTGDSVVHIEIKKNEIIGSKVFLKVTPLKVSMRFGNKWKLSPRFIGPFEIFERVGNVSY